MAANEKSHFSSETLKKWLHGSQRRLTIGVANLNLNLLVFLSIENSEQGPYQISRTTDASKDKNPVEIISGCQKQKEPF